MEEADETSALLPREEVNTKASENPLTTTRHTPHAAYQPPHYENGSFQKVESPSTPIIWLVLPIFLLGVFVANADGSLVVVSSQQIASEFNALQNAQWLVTSFGLAQCASQPLYGKLSDIFGRKSNLIVAYFLFGAGCFLCGVGRTLGQVLAGRAISGIGGAGMTALVSVIIADMVPVRNVAACRSYVNVAATVGRALGGPVGGWLCDTIGWRWGFYGQVPLIALGLVLILWKLPSSSATPSLQQKQTFTAKVKRVDGLGALFLALTIIAFLLALDFGAKELPLLWVILLSVAFVVFSVAFWTVERFWAKEPILPLRLLLSRVATTSYLLAGLQMAAQFSTFYSTPIYYQLAADSTTSEAGLRLVPAVVGNVTAGLLAGWVISRSGRYKYLTVLGSIFACTGYILITTRWRGSTNWPETLYIFCGGFGSGTVGSTVFIHLAANLEVEDIAIAGTTLYLTQNIFALVGIQSTTTILHAQLRDKLDASMSDTDKKQKIIELAVSSVHAIKLLPPKIKALVVRAYIDSLTWTFGASLVYALFGLVFALSIQEKRLE